MIVVAAFPISTRLLRVFCGLAGLLLLHFPCNAAGLRVTLVLSGSEAPYQTFLQAFRKSLPASIQLSTREYGKPWSGGERQDGLIVTVGEKAAAQVAPRAAQPVLAALLPSFRYARLVGDRRAGSELSAIFVDQPWERQVGLLRAVLPYRNRVGVLLSAGTDWQTEQLRRLLAQRGAALVARVVDPPDALSDDLEYILSHSDVLLAVPDSSIYNSSNIRDIMLSSYRHGVPLVGLSQAYVNAGALCAVFSTLEQLAAQTAAAVADYARSGRLPGPQYPESYTIALNQQVARSLEIELPAVRAIREQIDSGHHDNAGNDGAPGDQAEGGGS